MHARDFYNPLDYPQGVPNPYGMRRHPYPSYEHGPDYTRPTFAMPFMLNPFNVLEHRRFGPFNGLGQANGNSEDTLRKNLTFGAAIAGGLFSVAGALLLLRGRPDDQKAAIVMLWGSNALYLASMALGRDRT